MNSDSFIDWLYLKPDWNKIKAEYNSGKKYQNRQDFEAIFWNGYIFVEQRVEAYFKKYKVFPQEDINELIFEFKQSFPKHDRLKALNYFDDLLELLIEKYKAKKKDSQADLKPINVELLEGWILPDFISKYIEIEKELYNLGYIDKAYKWKKKKTELANYVCVIINYKYFKPIVDGKKIKDFHKVHLISERFGYGKTGLSETWKKHNKNIDLAKIPFSWIEAP